MIPEVRACSILSASTSPTGHIERTPEPWGLPWPVEPRPLRLPADSLTPGANLAQETRCPAVGTLVMSAPISAMSRCAAVWPPPGISSSRSTAWARGAISSWSLASSSARSASRASTRPSILPSRKACWSVKNPVNASSSNDSLARIRARASCARRLGSRSPATSAASMARPDTPKMSEPTTDSLIWGSSSSLLDPLLLRGPGRHQIRPVAGHLPQLPDRSWGDEAGPEQLPLGELAQPDRIQGVGLGPPGEVLDVTGIDQPGLEPVGFQQVEDPSPVVAGGLHHHPGHAQLGQPVGQHQQPAGHRRVGPDLLQPLARAALARDPYTAGQLGLAHVQGRDSLDDLIVVVCLLQHPGLLGSDDRKVVARRSRRATGRSDPRARGDSEGPTGGSQHPAYQRPPTTKEIRRQRATTPIFIRERAPPQRGTAAYQAYSRDAF